MYYRYQTKENMMNKEKQEQLAKALGYLLGAAIGMSVRVSLAVGIVYVSLLLLEWIGFISTGVLL